MTFEILFILKSRKSTLKPLANRLAWARPQCLMGPQVVTISPDWGNRQPNVQPHADPKSEVPTEAGPKHLQTRSCRFRKHWGHMPLGLGMRKNKDADWGSCCVLPPVLGSVDWRGYILPNVLESLPPASLSFPSQDTGPSQAGRTIWPSLGNAPWADRCQVMLFFHERCFNAGFVSSCSRTSAKQIQRPLGPSIYQTVLTGALPRTSPQNCLSLLHILSFIILMYLLSSLPFQTSTVFPNVHKVILDR